MELDEAKSIVLAKLAQADQHLRSEEVEAGQRRQPTAKMISSMPSPTSSAYPPTPMATAPARQRLSITSRRMKLMNQRQPKTIN